MNELLVSIEAVGLLIVVIGGYASVRALAKARGVEASVALLTTANDGLRKANEDLKIQMLAEGDRNMQKLHRQELECTKQIAELRGQVNVLTGNLAHEIVTAVIAALPH